MVADAAAFITGVAFVSPAIVLPLFMERLTGSTVLVGVVAAMQMAGWYVPQLATASLVEHRPRKKPFILKVCAVGRLPLLLLPVLLLTAPHHRGLILAVFLGTQLLFFASDGVTGVPWKDICAKTIAPRMRGRFFGAMQLIGGVLAVGAGAAVRQILGHPRLPYPRDYALLFAIEFALLMASLGLLALIREPLRPVREARRGLWELVRAAPALLRAKPQLARMVAVRWLADTGAIAVPFYAVYARVELGLPEATAGIFISAQMAGGIAAGAVWALLSDRWGSKRVIQGSAMCSLIVPLFAWLAPPLLAAHGPGALTYGYAVTFFLLGAIINGVWIGYTNFVLESVGDKERASYVGLTNTLGAPAVLFPILGGWVIGVTSYHVVFAVAAAAAAAALAGTAWLREPRQGNAATEQR
jgi:MFS family permease